MDEEGGNIELVVGDSERVASDGARHSGGRGGRGAPNGQAGDGRQYSELLPGVPVGGLNSAQTGR